ncbi:hypothetical protein MTP99_011097 [Tenebrio molitor]|nr:hypothetical protein MTP99_011097 [Tenebrio molitor]
MGLITGLFKVTRINFRPFLDRPYEAQRKLDEVGHVLCVVCAVFVSINACEEVSTTSAPASVRDKHVKMLQDLT